MEGRMMCCISSFPATTLLAVRQPLSPLKLTLPERTIERSEILCSNVFIGIKYCTLFFDMVLLVLMCYLRGSRIQQRGGNATIIVVDLDLFLFSLSFSETALSLSLSLSLP